MRLVNIMNKGSAPVLTSLLDDFKWQQNFVNTYLPYNLMNSKLLDSEQSIQADIRPQKLYRYSSYTKEYLKMACAGDLYLSDPRTLNDPYDVYANIDATNILEYISPIYGKDNINKMIEALKASEITTNSKILTKFFANVKNVIHNFSSQSSYDDCWKYLNDVFKKDFKSEMSYASLAGVCDNSAMWSYYGADHQGYCLEYELQSPANHIYDYSQSRGFWLAIMPIIYTDRPFDGNKYLKNTPLNEQTSINLEKFAFILMTALCNQKLATWKHEKEWRILISSSKADLALTGRGVAVIEESLTPLKLTAIHTGLRMPVEQKEQIQNCLNKTDINFYEIGIAPISLQLRSTSTMQPDEPSLLMPKD